MAGFQNSTKLYTESSNTSALTTVSTHYSQQALPHPTTPTSPASSLPNSSSTTGNSNITPTPNSSAKNNITSVPRSLNTAPVLQHSNNSAFSPYQNNIPQHPTPVTTPTSTKPQLVHPDSTMMASHLDSNTLIYPQHTAHFANPPNQFWPSWNTLSGGSSPGAVAISNTPGGSAFMPAVGYGATPGSLSQHNPRPKLTTTIWEDEGTLCYQVDARGICVARRQDNNMINGTKLLNVVGMSRGKRDGILKNEKGRVVVKVGAMHLKGVWITFGRAKTLAQQFKIHELLYPLFVEDPGVFLHNYTAPMQTNRIPSMNGVGAHAQWRPHTFTNFNGPAYDRQWYGYSNGSGIINQAASQPQDHSSPAYPPNANNHAGQHIDDEYSNYAVINGQPQGQQNVVVSGTAASFQPRSPVSYDTGASAAINSGPNARPGTPVYPNVKSEDTVASNGNNYYRQPGIYNHLVSTDVANGTTPQSNSPSQIIGQKRGYVGDDETDDYNGSNQPSPPLAMHPPPLNGIPVNTAMNVAAGSFPSPMNASPNSSPGSSAFSGWPAGKRVKYEFSESTASSSAQSSPRISGYALPGLANGAGASATPATPTQTYTSSSLQLVTNAQQGSPHYSSAGANANGPATGTTTPTTEGYFQDNSNVLHTPSPDNAPVEEARRYEQYRREDTTNEEISSNNWNGIE
ncbi:3640_t:CDS:2 [Paraglomus occultum]|uniref:3640_t:CDS:1 n=1 Tax=Paraglomus occultum TaxID=144539 RepID=A0A9N9G2C6_9GLOM|nr:3640_t:CDS:2 [Paraglomus occultum]